MRLGRLPGVRRLPSALRSVNENLVLFDSWRGAYSDNPRAISEELTRRGAPYEQVWVANGPAAPLPAGVTTVAPESRPYLEALGAARYVVTNISMPAYYRKRPATTYVQTWHGTPLKRIAFDIARPTFAGHERYLADLRHDVAKWNLLLSPNRFSTEVFRQAFGYRGEIVESGYPRNDILSSAKAEATRRAVRDRLDIREDAQAILYAPTWRDSTGFELQLDLGVLTERLGDGWVTMLRAHHLAAASVAHEPHRQLRDVSAYTDIRDLYLAADVLVTDYSSAMFDFAATGKPMVFFTYDLAEYRDEVRGFYFDFEREAPGPLVATTAEMVEALQAVDEVSSRYAGAYKHFVERFCYLEDGEAAARVVDAVFDRPEAS